MDRERERESFWRHHEGDLHHAMIMMDNVIYELNYVACSMHYYAHNLTFGCLCMHGAFRGTTPFLAQ